MNRSVFMCACALTLVTNAGLHPETPKNTTPPKIKAPAPQTLIPATVIRIFDADTILVQIGDAKRRYQLLGVNAPQFLPKDRTPKPFSIESRRFIEQLLLGESIYLQHDPNGDRDSFSRRSAYVFRAPDMLFVNLELIRQGYAKHDTRHMSLYVESFEHYETKAKELSRGIWDPNAPELNFSEPTNELVEDPEPKPADVTTEKPETRPNAEPQTTTTKASPSNTIYITKSGSKYHTKDCPHLTNSNKPTTREDVEKTHEPCKTCRPNN